MNKELHLILFTYCTPARKGHISAKVNFTAEAKENLKDFIAT